MKKPISGMSMFLLLVSANALYLLMALFFLDPRTFEFWFITLLVIVPSALLALLHAKHPA